uniref:Uncharacterized protein n=1 Tax=Peronospora matthiolae TaxID=2874970 RepID=A0AAV1UGB2_9STRA
MALKLFVSEFENVENYVVTYKGTMRCKLAMDQFSTRKSFQQFASGMKLTKERCGLSKRGCMSVTIVGQSSALASRSPCIALSTCASTSRSGCYHTHETAVPTAASTSSTCAYACPTAASC